MESKHTIGELLAWLFVIFLLGVGIVNIFLVHPVPGIAYLLLALVFLPPLNSVFTERFGSIIPLILKIILAVLIILFTFGVSDLGDIIDKF